MRRSASTAASFFTLIVTPGGPRTDTAKVGGLLPVILIFDCPREDGKSNSTDGERNGFEKPQ